MRADRPLLVSAAFLGAGLWIIFRYGASGAVLNTAQPWYETGFHLNLAAAGPGVLAGAVLAAVGALLLAWSILVALAWHVSQFFNRDDDDRDFIRITSRPESFEESPPASFSGERHFL